MYYKIVLKVKNMNLQMITNRIEQLLDERHLTMGSLMDNAEISTTMYQWKKNRNRDATRYPSLKSIEKICNSLDISLSYFFAVDKSNELNVKQKEVANSLLLLNEKELSLIDQMIQMLIENKNVANGRYTETAN